MDHLCKSCFLVDGEYHTVKNGKNICDECGGTVLIGIEIADYVAELQSSSEDRLWE